MESANKQICWKDGPLERYAVLMQEVWREVCRHLEVAEATARITALVRSRLPLEALVVRRLDRERGVLETVVGPVETEPRAALTPAQMDALVEWLNQGQVTPLPAGARPPQRLEPLVAGLGRGTVLVAPLAGVQGAIGVLLLVVDPAQATDDHLALAGLLREPLAASLEMDQRVRELNALREAAEADKRTLINRLGRDEVLGEIVGAEAGLRGVMERVDMCARSDVTVLILGETGAGKEVIARAVHERSPRSRGPFFRVNCGAIPPELIDSELFGHEKGSFTGATGTRRGWFERAGGGTLFLDEVGELPLAAQVRLLRVLQDGSFQRVGGEHTLQADVRVVAATHCDLAAKVREGGFREDLWYRLAVFPLLLPPLRDRREDIPALAHELAARAARRYGLRPCRPTAAQLDQLLAYRWPGNVRELGSVIDRAAILGNGERLEISIALGSSVDLGVSTTSRSGAEPATTEILPLDEAVARHIRAALDATAGRIEGPHGAAGLLRINPHTLRARMRKLGIDWQRYRRRG
jgi:transcriptional regulator with GAF, ATPase, and Fis domain